MGKTLDFNDKKKNFELETKANDGLGVQIKQKCMECGAYAGDFMNWDKKKICIEGKWLRLYLCPSCGSRLYSGLCKLLHDFFVAQYAGDKAAFRESLK